MAVIKINERTRQRLEITFIDEQNVPIQPTSARWRAYCDTTGTDLTDWADLSVQSNGKADLQLPASLFAIINPANRFEEKVIAAEAYAGTDDQVSSEQVFQVKNLKKTS